MGYYKEKQIKEDDLYMGIAELVAKRSHDNKYKVGAVIANGEQILAYGWNGTPRGCCNTTRDNTGNTRAEVIHAETNAIAKLARSGGSAAGATIYTTHSPCMECAKLILQAGIERVVYKEKYYGTQFIKIKDMGLNVERY